MTQQPAGWYDDPQDPAQLRYWDGVIWSSHVSPKISPAVERSTIGMPYGVIPAAARPQSPGSQGAQGPRTVQDGFASPQQGQGQQGHTGNEWPAYGQGPGALGQPTQGWQSQGLATTPDGVVLSGWWKRVLARILDGFIVWILALPFTYTALKRTVIVFNDYLQQVITAADAGSAAPVQPTAELTSALMPVTLTVLVFYLVYEIGFLTWRGATPGRMIVGISVRLRDTPGPPPLVAVLKRTAVKDGGSILGAVPFLKAVSPLFSLFTLVDDLWPLWDPKKQAIHDKVAATNVVVGPQPRRRA